MCIKEVSQDKAEEKSFSFYVLLCLLNFKPCEPIKYSKTTLSIFESPKTKQTAFLCCGLAVARAGFSVPTPLSPPGQSFPGRSPSAGPLFPGSQASPGEMTTSLCCPVLWIQISATHPCEKIPCAASLVLIGLATWLALASEMWGDLPLLWEVLRAISWFCHLPQDAQVPGETCILIPGPSDHLKPPTSWVINPRWPHSRRKRKLC